jgi:hypothetical protein
MGGFQSRGNGAASAERRSWSSVMMMIAWEVGRRVMGGEVWGLWGSEDEEVDARDARRRVECALLIIMVQRFERCR